MKLEELFFDEERFLFEMASLSKEETGLNEVIYASPRQHSAGPRIKVNYDGSLRFDKHKNFSVSITIDPKVVAGDTEANVIRKIGASELSDIYDWVRLNIEPLLEYWNDKIMTAEFLRKIRSL